VLCSSLPIDLNIRTGKPELELAMFNKKGQGMHMFGTTDIFIVLFGIIIGIVLLYYARNISFVQNLFCAAAAAP
jgi:hypothetical protein